MSSFFGVATFIINYSCLRFPKNITGFKQICYRLAHYNFRLTWFVGFIQSIIRIQVSCCSVCITMHERVCKIHDYFTLAIVWSQARFEPPECIIHTCYLGWPYQALVLHAIMLLDSTVSHQALRCHTLFSWPWDSTYSYLSLRPLVWTLPVCIIFTPVPRPWDSTVSHLALRPSVMRQHRFMPLSLRLSRIIQHLLVWDSTVSHCISSLRGKTCHAPWHSFFKSSHFMPRSEAYW